MGAPSFADLLRRYRTVAGLTQEALAERARLSVRAVSDLERGARRLPRPDTIALLADALGLSPAERATLTTAARPRPALASLAPLDESGDAMPAVLRPLTSLLGRERDVAEACGLLRRADVRLLTLTGPAGVGKTRLALQVAANLWPSFADHVVVVQLAPLRASDLVMTAVARMVGVTETAGQPLLAGLGACLRGRELLLLLDNFEHVLDAAPLVAEIVAACPRLKVLTTSRAPLRVRGEHELPVSPLPLPDQTPRPDDPDILRNAAVALFAQRAQAANPWFRLTVDDAVVVGDICRRLDGLPLAIELAAARVKILPPRALLARLEQQLHVLAGGPRDLPERQQTMRQALAWSYELLDGAEQRLFRHLGVFVGGCTLEAVAAVYHHADGADGIPPAVAAASSPGALDGLAMLVDKSLLRMMEEPDGTPRFAMLETVRAYALERLTAHDETGTVQRRHAAYFLSVALKAAPHLSGAGQAEWLERLEQELANLRAALQWARESSDLATGVQLAIALGRFWYVRGYLSEGRRWLEELLESTSDGRAAVAPVLRAQALIQGATLATEQGDFGRAVVLAERGLALNQEGGDEAVSAEALNVLGTVAQYQGFYEQAAVLYERSLAGYHAAGDAVGRARALNNLAAVARARGDTARAAALYNESLLLGRELGDTWSVATALDNLGEVARDDGHDARAVALHEESLGLRRALGDRWGSADSLANLGRVLAAQGHDERAARLYAESVGLYQEVGDTWGTAVCLEGLAAVADDGGDAERAAQLLSAASALRETIGAPMPPADRAAYDRLVASVRSGLGEETYDAAWTAGHTWPYDWAGHSGVPAALAPHVEQGTTPEQSHAVRERRRR